MDEIRLQWMRPAQILEARARCPIAYLPIGPLEWHGPHLPFGMDPLNAENVALLSARETGGVVVPTLFAGTERERTPEDLRAYGFSESEFIEGMDFPANSLRSFYTREEVFALLLRDWTTMLWANGFRMVFLVNGHGAVNHYQTLERLCKEMTARGPGRLAWAYALPPEECRSIGGIAHAGDLETSIMQAIRPDTVDLGTLPPLPEPLRNTAHAVIDGPTFQHKPTPDHTVRPEYDPRRGASPEKGEDYIRSSVAFVVGRAREELAGLE